MYIPSIKTQLPNMKRVLLFRSCLSLFFISWCHAEKSPWAYDTTSANGGTLWLSEIFAESERHFEIHPAASDECKNDFNTYQMHLKNHSFWAVRMLESSQWPKHGLLMGKTPFFGYFDECVAINAYGIMGQHCLVENVYFLPPSIRHLDSPSDESVSAWLALQMFQNDPFRMGRNKLRWTLCAPSSCSTSDLAESLRRTLHATFGRYSINITTNLEEGWCQTSVKSQADIMFYSVTYFLYALLAIVLLFSVVLKTADNKLPGYEMMKCFSMQKNYHELTDVVPEREYMSMHLMKVVLSGTMIFYHSVFFMTKYYFYYNTATVEQLIRVLQYPLLYGLEVPDMLFFFGGYLMCKSFVKSKNKPGVMDVWTKIATRWLRVFSTYLIVRLFYTYVLPALTNGVLWHELQSDATLCKTNLLDALLTLPSARSKALCIFPSWHIPVDFQLFSMAYTCLSLCRHYEISRVKVLVCLISAAIMWASFSIFRNNYEILFFMDFKQSIIERCKDKCDFHSAYLSLSTRLGPYMIGVLTSLLVHELNERQYVLTKKQLIGGFAVTLVVKYAVVKLTATIYDRRMKNEDDRRLWYALFGGLFHTVTNWPINFLYFVYFANGFIFFKWLEERIPNMVVPLSRLSYSVSLAHYIVIVSHLSSQRTHILYTNYSLVHTTVADIVLSYLLAFLVYMLIEGPTQNLVSLATRNVRRLEAVDNMPKKEN